MSIVTVLATCQWLLALCCLINLNLNVAACVQSYYNTVHLRMFSNCILELCIETRKHLKNVGPIRHSEPTHAALPFTRRRYCRVARRLRIDVHDDDDDNA